MLDLLKIFNYLFLITLGFGLGIISVGKFGDPKKITDRKQLVKLGFIILVAGFLLMLLQTPVLYSLLGNY